jgi:hypothetical protein
MVVDEVDADLQQCCARCPRPGGNTRRLVSLGRVLGPGIRVIAEDGGVLPHRAVGVLQVRRPVTMGCRPFINAGRRSVGTTLTTELTEVDNGGGVRPGQDVSSFERSIYPPTSNVPPPGVRRAVGLAVAVRLDAGQSREVRRRR